MKFKRFSGGGAVTVLAATVWYFAAQAPTTDEVASTDDVFPLSEDPMADVGATSIEPGVPYVGPSPSEPPRVDLARVTREEDIPDSAANVELARNTLGSNEHRLIPIVLDCSPKNYGEVYCVPIPDSLIANHPYFTYPIESLFLIRGDPIAHQVISQRISRSDPDGALQHAVWATGLSGGRAEPLVQFVQTSGWATFQDGEPMGEAFEAGYVVWRAAESLGYPTRISEGLREALLDQMTEAEVDALDVRVTELLDSIASVPVAREWDTRSWE